MCSEFQEKMAGKSEKLCRTGIKGERVLYPTVAIPKQKKQRTKKKKEKENEKQRKRKRR
jgi:hypothetical protein